MNSKIKNNHQGFTLIELMIAIVIFVIIITLIIDNYNQQQGRNVTQNQITEVQQNLRAAFHVITSEIRMAGFDPQKNNPNAKIIAAGDGKIVVSGGTATKYPLKFAYIDSNGTSLKIVTMNLFDSSIDYRTDTYDEIQITKNGNPIAENIKTLEFTYFDKDGNQITAVNHNIPGANIENIKAVQVMITARADETELDRMKNSGGSDRTLVSMIKLRNL